MTSVRECRRWTAAEDIAIAEMRARRATAAEIADAICRTEKAVSERVRRTNVPLPTKDAEWLAALASGRTTAEIAAERGVSERTVEQARWRLRKAGHGLPRCRYGPSPLNDPDPVAGQWSPEKERAWRRKRWAERVKEPAFKERYRVKDRRRHRREMRAKADLQLATLAGHLGERL